MAYPTLRDTSLRLTDATYFGNPNATAGVRTINTLDGDITLAEGAGITLTPVGDVITIAAPATGGTVTSVDASGGTTGLTFSGGPVTTTGTVTAAGTLVIGNGGTGQTTAQLALDALVAAVTNGYLLQGNGTHIVLAAPPTFNQDTSGNAGSATYSKQIPRISKTAGYVLEATNAGCCISITTGGITVPPSIFSAGDAVTILNNSAVAQTISQGAGVTLHIAGVVATGTVTLGAYGMVTLWWDIGGANPVVFVSGTGAS